MKIKVSIAFITIGIIGIQVLLFINFIQKEINKQIVNQIEMKEYNSKNYYVGFIEVCSLKIPLVYGTTSRELNQNIVGIDNHSNKNHLILAGHAIPSVFLCLHDIKLKEKIKVKFNEYENYYDVDYKIIVNYKDISIYKNTGLTLITCIDNYRRLIVHAKTA